MKRLFAILSVAAILGCSNEPTSVTTTKPRTLGALIKAPKPYEGEWREIEGSDRLKIYADGNGYVVVNDGKKYVAAVENGLLRVYHPLSTLTALVTSDDHLLLGADEYRRVDAAFREAVSQTMENMRSLATALEARATDTNAYGDLNELTDVPLDRVQQILEPTYIRNIPRTDAWETAFRVRLSTRDYEIRSLGANRTYDTSSRGVTSHPDCDVVFANGNFTAYPEGH